MRITYCLGIGLGLITSGLEAQSLTHGGLEGVVRDSSGAPVDGALVTLTGEDGGAARIVTVLADGTFRFTFLPSGPYQVLAEQIGYRPVVLRGVRVEPGARPRVSFTLRADSLPVTRIDTLWRAGPAHASEPGAGRSLPRELFQRFATQSDGLAGLDWLTGASGEEWALQGLPLSAAGPVVDGLPFSLARNPAIPLTDPLGPAFPLGAFGEAAVQLAPLDIEWGDMSGGVISGLTRRGTRDFTGQAFGHWSPGALSDSRFFDPSAVTTQTFFGGMTLAGPVVSDTADFVVGAEGGRFEGVRPPLWSGTAAEAIAASALDSAGQSLAGYLAPRLVRQERAGGFGRFSWNLTPRNLLEAWVSGGWFSQDEPVAGSLAAPGLGSRVEGTDIAAGASVISRLGDRVANELRAGFTASSREYSAGALPATFFGAGVAAGTDLTVPGRFETTAFRLRNALHIDAGGHGLKLGVGLAFSSYDQTYTYGTGGAFYLGDALALAGFRGAYLGAAGTPQVVQFGLPELSAFLQDRWEIAAGFSLLVGLRYDLELIPRSRIPRSQAWLDQTGIANDSVPRTLGKWSSRIGFDWRVGESDDWRVRGGVGVYQGQVDPAALAEAIGESGRIAVHRGVGDMGTWPAAPDAAAAPEVGTRLTLLGAELLSPRSGNASLGIARRLGRSGMFEVALNVRHTDYLPRRHDLNRPLGATGGDQYGRPVYGTLVKERGVVAAAPSSPRRFSGFELVSALDGDGYSDYWGVTVRLVQPASRYLRLHGAYTYSRATDNWLATGYGGPYAELTPFPDSLDGRDWASSTADLDVPHRVAAGIELRPLGSNGLTVAARYRWRSGAAFTPGLAPGVDANGDGSFTNDPAFVDDTLPGMSEVLARVTCLRAQAGEFAERNSCQDPAVGTLDLRLGIAPLRRYPVEIWIEGFNLTQPEEALWDHALYAVDPAAPLAVDAGTGVVTVPLVVNANFGQRLALRTPGRTLRLGLRVNH